MKKPLIVLFLLVLSIEMNAQTSTFKAGGNFNADIVSHKLGKVNYPSWEISYERSLGKKFSINGTFNYAKRTYKLNNGLYWFPDGTANGFTIHGSEGYTDYDLSFIPEGRYYLKSNNSGIYFQFGIPFTYTITKWSLITTSNQYSTEYYSHSYAISTIGGFGIKYPLSPRFGVEMNMSISPSFNFLDVDYGTSGFIKTGVKLFFSLDKTNPANINK